MPSTSTLLCTFLLSLFFHASLQSQVTIGFPQRPQTINVCGADSLSYFSIEIQNSTELESVEIRMPEGVEYVPGSLEVTSSSGFILEDSDITNLNRPVFAPDVNALVPGNFVEFTILKTGGCDAIEFANQSQLPQDTLSVQRDMVIGDTAFTSSYDINYASISTSYVSATARDTVVNDLPSDVCREIQIVNGGTGYLSRVQHQVIPGSDLEDYTIRYGVDTILPVSANGDTLFYEFDLTQPPFANTFGDGDSLIENGESIIFEECFTVNSCDFSNGTVRHQSYWGCGGSICQFGNIINGNVDLQFSQPDLKSSIDFRDNIVCMDGSDRGIIRMKVWNDGTGPAVLNRLSVRANGANTAIDTSYVSITYDGMDIKSYFPVSNPTTNPGLSCGTDVARLDLESSDFLNSFQLAPGDTVYAEMQYIMCCPESCGDYDRSNPSIHLRGSDLCGNNNRSASQNSGTGGSASVEDPVVSGNSIMMNGQVETFCVDYPNYTFLSVTPTDSSYVSVVVGLPDGLVFDDPMTTTVMIGGNNIPIQSAMETVTGDSLVVQMLLTDVPATNSSLQVCFDLRAVCTNGMGGLASLTLGQSTSINCDPLCMIRLNCSDHDILLFGCEGPGDCAEGGGNIFSYEVQRVSFGYEDPENNRDWTSFVRADSADVNVNRAMVGDTIRHRSKLGFAAGTFTSWDQAVYRETYTAGWDAMLCPDTAWVVIRNGGTTYTVGGLLPSSIQNGFEYDLSVSSLSNLGDLPANYEFSDADTLYLSTQYAFCKDNAPDWFSVQPGTYRPVNERQNVIFTGSFEATPVNESNGYACGEAYDEMLFLGAALSVDIKSGGFSGDGCDRDFRYLFEIRQNIGGVLSGNTSTYDFFPNEFRPLYIPDSIAVKKQPDLAYKNARLVTRQIQNQPPELNKDIPLTYENDSLLVFKVRDVHDAFGGMLFPYDEENADLRYYIEFQRSCASPLAMRTDLEISYTTPLCPGEDFETMRTNLSTGNNTDLSNIDYIQTPKSKPANNNNTCFELSVRPRGGQLSYTWLEFPANANVTILSVSESGTPVTPDAEGLYRLGQHDGNATKIFTICADLNSCDQSDFQVLFGWDCNGYPGDVMYEATCSYDTLTYTMETVPSEIQLNLVNQPGKDPVSGNYPDLCAPLVYELVINSANAGSVIEPNMDISLPVGFTVDSIEAEYPNGSNRETIPFAINGNVLSVNLYEHSEVMHDSLPGTGTDITPVNRQIFIRLHGHTGCNFRSGSRLFFSLFADQPCGGPAIGNGGVIGSDRLIIQGLQPYETSPEFDVDIAEGITCAINTPVNVSFEVEGGDFVGADSGVIIFSPGIDFVPGSLACTNTNPAACPEIDRIEADPDHPGGTLVFISYPSTVSEGDIVNYTFDVVAQENNSCGQMVNIEFENYVTVSGLECNGMVCPNDLTGITGSTSIDLEVSHPDLTFDGLTVNAINSTPFVEYSGSLTVSERDLSAGDSLYIIAYCSDGSGMSTGLAVDSVLITGPATIGTSVSYVGSFLQSQCVLDNGLFVTAEPINGCLCTEPNFYQQDVGMEERTFDLALTKTFTQPSNMEYGDTLVFDINIFNQGDVQADSFEITDYLPSGLLYVSDNDADGWIYDNAGKAKRWITGTLAVGADTTIQISLKLENTFEVGAYLNFAEISQHVNPFNLDDIDSTPDDDPENDAGGKPDSPADNYADGDGTGTPGGGIPVTDEDDHDPALVKIADLALRKVMSDETPGPYGYGDTLRMNIELYNQGNVPANYIEVTDYLPEGFTYIDDAVLNPGWDGSDPSNPVFTWGNDTLYQTDSDTISIYVVLNMVDMPDSSSWTNFSEISLARDTTGMNLDDIDSAPDDDPDLDAGGKPHSPADDYIEGDGSGTPGDGVAETDEDDHDPLRVAVYDLALKKTINPANTGPYRYGDTILLDITVFNQGNESGNTIAITDYIPDGMTYVPGMVNGWDDSDPLNPVYVIEDTLNVGQDTMIQIPVSLGQSTSLTSWDNYAEISDARDKDGGPFNDIDSDPDNEQDNDYGAKPDGDTDDETGGDAKQPGEPNGNDDPDNDEDDHDVERIRIVDFALIKQIDSLNSEFPLQFGSLIKFDIIIQNQGNVVSDSIRVMDYVPAGFGFDSTLPQNIAEGWQPGGTATMTNHLEYGEMDTISIYKTLQPVSDPMMDNWINFAEIIEAYDTTGTEIGGEDFDSEPGSDAEEERNIHPGDEGDDDLTSTGRDDTGSEDDHDPAGVMFLDLALFKEIDSTETNFPVRYGDLIKFDIHVINQEGVMADSVRIADYVPEGYSFDPTIPVNQAYGWHADATTVIEGPVNVGDTVTASIYLTLQQISVPNDRSWVNYSEILEAWNGGMEIAGMDIDSKPGSDSPEEHEIYPGQPGDDDAESISRDSVGSEDDHDPALVEVFDLALRKTTEEEVAYPGLEAPFDITVFNQGSIPATNIEVTDYIPPGYTFDVNLNQGWTGSDPLVTYVIPDTLYPGESTTISIILTVTGNLDPDDLINVAEISTSQDTSGMNREDIDGIFDQDPENDAGGEPDSPADDYVDGDGTGNNGDGEALTDEDNADPAKIIPCLQVNCHAYINPGFGEDCEIEITPDMLLEDNRLALVRPDFYKVELFYGPGILIPDNILRPEHVGKNITARITFLIDECGGGTCESTIVLDKPNACIIKNTLDTTVYCIDPFLALDPLDPAYPKPDVANVCSTGELKLELSPDWIMPVSCDEENDTAEVIFREWTATTAGGERCTGVDTIVVFRLPKLTPAAFIGTAEDSFYCDLDEVPNKDDALNYYVAWKQPVGLHDYELPYTKLRGVTYEIPLTIIETGLQNAQSQGQDVYNEYIKSVILRKTDGTDVTIGDIVSGDYINDLIANATNTQKRYGFLQALIELNEEPVKIVLESLVLKYYPYLLLQPGDFVLSEGGNFEQVDEDWFFNGHGNPENNGAGSPYWFSGSWPSIYGNGDCISYCDAGTGNDFGCIRIQVPSLNNEIGFDPENCDTICLTTGGVHCGITIEKDVIADSDGQGWTGSCPQTRGIDTRITQICWAATPNNCANDLTAEDVDLVTSYDSTAKKVNVHLSQWHTLIDTVGPIFDFCYPAEWDQQEGRTSIRNGVIGDHALAWEQDNPTTYRVGSHSCEAEVYVPDVRVIDNCSGVHSVKAMINVKGDARAVAMERTAREIEILANGDTCTIYTYSHTSDPIVIPFSECDGRLNEVRYEAADNCWNQSTWIKYIRITDDVPPTVVTNPNLNVTLMNKIAWAHASSFDEGSWDNCSIGLRLGRRSDWRTDSAMVNLCDTVESHAPYDNWVDLLDDLGVDRSQALTAVSGGTVGASDFNSKYNVDDLTAVLNEGEVEQHYFDQIVWLWKDEEQCGKKVAHGWLYSIAAFIAEHCSAADEHGNVLKVRDLETIFDRLTNTSGYGKEIAYLGGGWTMDVPFQCEDACEGVAVELLVMDHCCNFGIGSAKVDVADESPTKLVKRLTDLDVSCEAYNAFYKDIVENAAALGEHGSADDGSGAFTALDSIFGGYVKTWVDNQNRPVDIRGHLLPPEDLNFDYQSISCGEKSETKRIPVMQHDGTIKWENQVTNTTYLDTTDLSGTNGIVSINCSASSAQDVWVDLDECGQGTITRRFFISGGCGQVAQEMTVEQVIHVKSACELGKSMFDLPVKHLGSKDAPICLPQGLSENYLPDTIGAVTVKPQLVESLCASVAIGKTIKELNVLDENSMKKYEITWSMIDWCADHKSSAREIKYVQTVIATIDPECDVSGGGDVSLISGHIMTEMESPVKEVEVRAILGQGSQLQAATSGNGDFNFTVDTGSSVRIVPQKNTGFSEGISTSDLIDIQRHILQKKELDSKYQRIAADVNGNGLIEGLDVLDLRKVVLNPNQVFANNTSWRFFDQSTDKEVFDINELTEDQAVNFTGVKIGDVNLSLSRQDEDSDPASKNRNTTGQLQLNMADKALEGGEAYRIDVRSDNFTDILGLQYTLNYAEAYVSIESIESGVLQMTKHNYLNYAPGLLTASWSAAEGVSANADEVLFTIVVKAKNAARLRDVLSLNDRVTQTEAYSYGESESFSASGGYGPQRKDVSLRFERSRLKDGTGFALYQNTPNPYSGETAIGFRLPEAGDAVMTIYDATGRVIKRIEGAYQAGYNKVRMTSRELGTTGVLYYQLDTDKYTATKKMILVE